MGALDRISVAAIPITVGAWKAYGPANRISEADVQREMSRTA